MRKIPQRPPPHPTHRRVLFVAMHFPPFAASSGYLRTLNFCQYLPKFGWSPIVLTASRHAHPSNFNPRAEAPPEIPVYRAFALDAQHHLSIAGKYPTLLALPDRWAWWWFDAVRKGYNIIRQHKPNAIVSTYPVATAHLVGYTLSSISGIPWVADFRDPMLDEHYPQERMVRWIRGWLERSAIRKASRTIFTSPSAQRLYQERYPQCPSLQFETIYNGFDSAAFASLEPVRRGTASGSLAEPPVLLHSGVLYPDVRDPRPFFQALAHLRRDGKLGPRDLRVRLRASGSVDYYCEILRGLNLQDMVSLEPPISYSAALQEMLNADGLLLLQGRGANRQIPTKLYEYVKAQRPILALVDRQGDTAWMLERLKCGRTAQIDSASDIEAAIPDYLADLRVHGAPLPASNVEEFTRLRQTERLAKVLDGLARADPRKHQHQPQENSPGER